MKSGVTNAATVILLASVGVFASGCVSQSKFEEVASERDQLSAENMRLERQNQELVGLSVALSEEVELLDGEVVILQTEMGEIEADLETLVVEGSIQMRLMKSGLRLILDDEVLFDSGSAKLSPRGKDAIARLSAQLIDVPYQVVVIGNTDNVPIGPSTASTYPSNWALAAARASAVVRQMADEGIPKGQLVAVSLGDTQPIASNDTAEGRSENRRIEVRLRPVETE